MRKRIEEKATEAYLLQQINQGMLPETWQQYHELLDKRRAERLTPDEHTALIVLSDQIEEANVRRIEYLVELTRLRQIPLAVLMQQLGIQAPPYGGFCKNCALAVMEERAMKTSTALAYIRQLCCLGLGGQVLVSALLRQLHTFIPSYGNTFFWVNAQYQIINMYDETSADLIVIGQYLQEYVNRGEREVIPALVRLCQALQGVFNGDPHTARPPMWHHGNPWGHFTFRAYWLEPAKPGTEGLIGITVQLQESVLLQCLRRMQEVRLSAREAEVGLWLLRGYTTQKIVERLYISVHTVIDHLRNLYEKLDVHGREELITKLLNRTPGTEREG